MTTLFMKVVINTKFCLYMYIRDLKWIYRELKNKYEPLVS